MQGAPQLQQGFLPPRPPARPPPACMPSPSVSAPYCSESNMAYASESSALPWSLLNLLMMRPVGLVWKKDSGARSTERAIRSWSVVAALAGGWEGRRRVA